MNSRLKDFLHSTSPLPIRLARLFLAITVAVLGPQVFTRDGTCCVAQESSRPRVIITTDINNGKGDPDDRQSLCHLLWHADMLDLRAIIPDRFRDSAIDACEIAFDLYEEDLQHPQNRFAGKGFPSADHLRRKVLIRTKEAAIDRVIAEAGRDDERPLWILAWGNLRLVSEILEQAPQIAPKIRLVTIGTFRHSAKDEGDGRRANWNGPGREAIYSRFPNLWWLEIDWTYNGMFPGQPAIDFKDQLAELGGNLGQHVRDVIDTVSWADNFRAGDTPSVLYLVDPDHDLDDPTQSSWAGRFTKPFPQSRPNYWTGIAGGHEWDFADPSKTWHNADAVYEARVATLLNQRPQMYQALVERLQTLYQSTAKPAAAPNPKGLQLTFDGHQPLIMQPMSPGPSSAAATIWKFNFQGDARFPFTLRYRAKEDTRPTIFLNSANLGQVSLAATGEGWQELRRTLQLQDGPNSFVVESGEELELAWLRVGDFQVAAGDKQLPMQGEAIDFEGHEAFVIMPENAAPQTPWVWYAPTLNRLPGPEENWMIERLLKKGIAIAGIDVGESYGSPKGRELYSRFYHFLCYERHLNEHPVLLARSRGGLMHYSWAAENSEAVAAIAGIYPVCNIASYPGIAQAAPAFGLSSAELAEQLAQYNPIDRLRPIAEAGIPVMHLHGDSDTIVPLELNSGLLAERLEALGGNIHLEVFEGQGHNMWTGWFQNPKLMQFIIANALQGKTKSR